MRETKSAVGGALRGRRVGLRAWAAAFASCAFAGVSASAGCSGGHDSSLSAPDGAAPSSEDIFGSSPSGAYQGINGDGGDVPFQWACGAARARRASPAATAVQRRSPGSVYDPAGLSPLYNVAVYIPTSPLPDPLPAGPSCGCTSLYPDSRLRRAR